MRDQTKPTLGTQRPGNGSTLLAIFLGSFFWTDTHWLEDVRKQGFRIPYPSHRRSQLFGENPDIEVTPPVSILSLCSFPIRRSDADDSCSFFLLLLLRLRLIVCYLGLYIFSYCVYNEKRCYHENQSYASLLLAQKAREPTLSSYAGMSPTSFNLPINLSIPVA